MSARTVTFPHVVISGGPHAKDTRISVDGVPVEKVTRVEMVADVNDVVRVTTYQLAEVVVEMDAAVAQGVEINVHGKVPDGDNWTYVRITKARGKTISEALRAAADQLDKKE